MLTARAGDLLPPILQGPPSANPFWLRDPFDVAASAWVRRTQVEKETAAMRTPDEWLLVVAWDES
ncbi:MAG: hypothetical protein ABL956_13905 [Hyphomonadaceae bacterium]